MKHLSNYKHVLALDPSGNFTEGKGTTGWAVLSDDRTILESGFISASDFKAEHTYWAAHLSLLEAMLNKYNSLGIVIEDYLLYGNKAKSQINSRMETPKLIGIMQQFLWVKNVEYCMQPAAEVKLRWSDDVLLAKGIITKKKNGTTVIPGLGEVCRHEKDAIRHGLHFVTFKNKKKDVI